MAATGRDREDFFDFDVAVAHWHVNAWGGAEYLVTRMAEALNCEQVYTVGTPEPEDSNPYGDVSFVDVTDGLSLRPLRKLQARIGRAFEYALWEDVDWRDYGHPDVLITSGATTRAVITPDDTFHVNYCHSPPRWFYDLYHDRKDTLTGLLGRPLIRYLRLRDATVDLRVDRYFANSPNIARRIKKYYHRDSEILYPPVDIDAYEDAGDSGFYLHLGRLDEEKGVPEIVESFIDSGKELVLAGGRGDVGSTVMERIAKTDTIDYRGFVSEAEKRELLGMCRAVVFNGYNEDFGIVPVEANASGKACLTRNEGFPGQFVTEGENGYHHDGTVAGISDVVTRFENEGISGSPQDHVKQFGIESFRKKLRSEMAAWYDEFNLR